MQAEPDVACLHRRRIHEGDSDVPVAFREERCTFGIGSMRYDHSNLVMCYLPSI